MLNLRSLFAAGLCSLVALVSHADAAIIVGGSGMAGAGTTTVPLTAGFNAALTAPVTITTGAPDTDFAGPLGGNPNTVTMSLDVYAMDQSFDVTFDVAPTLAGPSVTEYEFAVTVTNMLNANGVDPGDAGKEINGFDVELIPTGGAIAGIDVFGPPPVTVGAPGSPLVFGGIIPTGIRYGGLSGGGGGIPFGATHTLFFSVDVAEFGPIPPGAGFTLRFTANPEPEAILLGCFTLAIGGFFVYRRRSQKKQATDLATTTA